MIFRLTLQEDKDHLKARGWKREPIKVTHSLATGIGLEGSRKELRILLRQALRGMAEEYFGFVAMASYRRKKEKNAKT